MPAAARLGDKAIIPADAHGCPACPHVALGPAVSGSPNVNINGRPALRKDDPGIQAACCGSNIWRVATGSPTVFINGRPAARLGDQTCHCGGLGKLTEGSPNVSIGGAGGAPQIPAAGNVRGAPGQASDTSTTSEDTGSAGATTTDASAVGTAGTTTPPAAVAGTTKPIECLQLLRIDPWFAPGAETLEVSYAIEHLAGTQVEMMVAGTAGPNPVIVQRMALDPAMTQNGRHVLHWDGRANQGPRAGHFLGPAASPYRLWLKAASGIEDSAAFQVQIQDLTLHADDKLFMNDPEQHIEVAATVTLRNKKGHGVPCQGAVEVMFGHEEDNRNAQASESHFYPSQAAQTNKPLGKRGDHQAKYWAPRQAYKTEGKDDYRSGATVSLITAGKDQGQAKVDFLPAGVGGDTYRIHATIYKTDGTTVLMRRETTPLVVWRRLDTDLYYMPSQSPIKELAATEALQSYFKPAFIEYEVHLMRLLPADSVVDYIGLWRDFAHGQTPWPDVYAKRPDEQPDKHDTREAITRKAQRWYERIRDAYLTSLDRWALDARLSPKALALVDYRHPKFSRYAPERDAITAEWARYRPWLKIDVEGDRIDPDERWVPGRGETTHFRSYVDKHPPEGNIEISIVHELAHASMWQFEREQFGPNSDHDVRGLMDPPGGGDYFSREQIDILRGRKRK